MRFSVWLHRRKRCPVMLYMGYDLSLASHYYTQAQAFTDGKFSTTILKDGAMYCTWGK